MCVSGNTIRSLLDPLGLFGKPKTPAVVQAPALSAPKDPVQTATGRKPIGGAIQIPAGGTALTGASGIANASLALGGTALLGGGDIKPGG
jgi:hypothetical protein